MRQVHSLPFFAATARRFRRAPVRFGAGMTTNGVRPVSMGPPLVLWPPPEASARDAANPATHMPSRDQDPLCHGFARAPDTFGLPDWSPSPCRVPLMSGGRLRLACRRSTVHDAGDHAIVAAEGAPLLFCRGRTGQIPHRAGRE